MAQKYRIYINEKVILITQTVPRQVQRYQRIEAQTFDLRTFYNEYNGKPGGRLYFVLCANAKDYLKKVVKSITLIEAAGGMVENAKGRYLFIYRNGKWDLPKGKLEKNETKRGGAVREVEEECGIKVSSVGKRICKTYHTYTVKGEVVLKRTYWYQMGYTGSGKLKPQKEEGITQVRWFKREETGTIIRNTFPSIMDVMLKLDFITETAAPL
ncbi:MAG: NUDIX domain-containing protein [Bacteroidetes bacterium]|nr:NUDIX domain-containing protein [Bacteroidota bacterium]